MTVQKMAHAYEQNIAERDYAISSTQLELANAKRHIKVLEVQRSALSDDVESARTEYEVLVAQLAEEQDSGDALKRELSSLRERESSRRRTRERERTPRGADQRAASRRRAGTRARRARRRARRARSAQTTDAHAAAAAGARGGEAGGG